MELGRPGRIASTAFGVIVAVIGFAWMLSGDAFFWGGALFVAAGLAWVMLASPPHASTR